MPSVWIKPRLTKSGMRFIVNYRLGGNGFPTIHAASCHSRHEAEKLVEHIRSQIAACKHITVPPTKRKGDFREEFVYFARLGDSIKIGVSVQPAKRCKSLSAELLHIEPGGRRRERELHERFAKFRVSGEWFQDHRQIRSYLEQAGEDAA